MEATQRNFAWDQNCEFTSKTSAAKRSGGTMSPTILALTVTMGAFVRFQRLAQLIPLR
jgi:hypothetical protein